MAVDVRFIKEVWKNCSPDQPGWQAFRHLMMEPHAWHCRIGKVTPRTPDQRYYFERHRRMLPPYEI